MKFLVALGMSSLAFFLFLASSAQAAHWQPPIGIPVPSFGINEVAPVYDQTNSLHYWVSGPSSCNDANNGGRGSPSAPRCTVPTTLSAGSLVEIRGGPYTIGDITWTSNGTATQPVFVRGSSTSSRPAFQGGDITLQGSYSILENIDISAASGVNGRIKTSGDHIAVRGSYIHDAPGATGSGVSNSGNDVVIYNNEIARMGTGPRDVHGVFTGCTTQRVWIVDNHIHDNSGDAVQFGHACWNNPPPSGAGYVYIGRNLMHDDRENAVDIKQFVGPAVISQNTIYGYQASTTSNGEAIRLNDEGTQGEIWILYNHIYNSGLCINGWHSLSNNWAIGNILHDCGHGIIYVDNIISNTIYNTVTRAILGNIPSQAAKYGTTDATNNIIHTITGPGEGGIQEHIGVDVLTCRNNLVWQNGAATTIKSTCSNTVSGDPLFVNAAANDFHLRSSSAAIDSGFTNHPAYDYYFNTYGLNIKVDYDKNVRPQGSAWDIGAYEFCVSNCVTPTPIPTRTPTPIPTPSPTPGPTPTPSSTPTPSPTPTTTPTPTPPSSTYEGYGSVTRGADDCPTGAATFRVTTLADSGPGSFRDAVSQSCRKIVFDIGGTITLTSGLAIKIPYFTIDGSTAPAPGITITTASETDGLKMTIAGTHDIILRHIRFTGYYTPGTQGSSLQNIAPLSLDGDASPDWVVQRIIFDHLAVANVSDGGSDIWGEAKDITVSNSMFYYNFHPMTISFNSPVQVRNRISLHHNVFARNVERNPQVRQTVQNFDYVNNIIYDWSYRLTGQLAGYGTRIRNEAGEGKVNANLINNAWIAGSNSPASGLIYGTQPGRDATDNGPATPPPQGTVVSTTSLGQLYVNGNILPSANLDHYSTTGSPLPVPAYAQVTTYPASDLRTRVLPTVGMLYRNSTEQTILDAISSAMGGGPTPTLTPTPGPTPTPTRTPTPSPTPTTTPTPTPTTSPTPTPVPTLTPAPPRITPPFSPPLVPTSTPTPPGQGSGGGTGGGGGGGTPPVSSTESIKPIINSFGIQPIISAGPITVSWNVSDIGGSFLNRVEVQRAPYSANCNETLKTGCAWTIVGTLNAPENSNLWLGSFNESLSPGTYWYGIHVLDKVGNRTIESAPIKVIVTLTVTPVSGGCIFNQNLSLGAVGDDVKCLQIYLNSSGFLVSQTGPGSSGQETTFFGLRTRAALVRFQQANRISPASGFFGPITRAFINQLPPTPTQTPTPTPTPQLSPTPQPVVFNRDLSLGSTGIDVRSLQQFLNNQGFLVSQTGPGSSGQETTFFGLRTRAALVRFQQANRISPASGFFGPITRAFINQLPPAPIP